MKLTSSRVGSRFIARPGEGAPTGWQTIYEKEDGTVLALFREDELPPVGEDARDHAIITKVLEALELPTTIEIETDRILR